MSRLARRRDPRTETANLKSESMPSLAPFGWHEPRAPEGVWAQA